MLARPFRNRVDAGRALAEHLQKYTGRPDVLVLALPRGGVPVAYEVALALGVPLDVWCEDFSQTGDREVHELLEKSREVRHGRSKDSRTQDEP